MIVSLSTITRSDVERMEQVRRAGSRSGRADYARLILLLDAGQIWAAIYETLDCNDAFIGRFYCESSHC